MHQDNLVWDDTEDTTGSSRLDQSIQEQAAREREALISQHRAQRTLSILRR